MPARLRSGSRPGSAARGHLPGAEVRTLGLLLDALGDGMLAYAPTGRLILVNRSARRLLGLPARAALDGLAVERMVAALAPRLSEPDLARQALAPAEAPAVPLELRLRDPTCVLRVVRHRLEDASGRALASLVLLRELPASQLVEQSWRQRLRIVAHDLRTPLTNIKAYTQLAASRLRRLPEERLADVPVAQVLTCLDTVNQQATRMAVLITELLDSAPWLEDGRAQDLREQGGGRL